MKSIKRIVTLMLVLTLLVTTVPAAALAAAKTKVDFENGKIPKGIHLALTKDGKVDGDPSKLSVKKNEGSKMLFIDSQEKGTPKLIFDVYSLVGKKNYKKVASVEYDVIIVTTDKTIGWNGGVTCGKVNGKGVWTNGTGWTIENYEKNTSGVVHLKETFTKGYEITNKDSAALMFMNWANNGTDMYIDNVQFKDAKGKVVPLQ